MPQHLRMKSPTKMAVPKLVIEEVENTGDFNYIGRRFQSLQYPTLSSIQWMHTAWAIWYITLLPAERSWRSIQHLTIARYVIYVSWQELLMKSMRARMAFSSPMLIWLLQDMRCGSLMELGEQRILIWERKNPKLVVSDFLTIRLGVSA